MKTFGEIGDERAAELRPALAGESAELVDRRVEERVVVYAVTSACSAEALAQERQHVLGELLEEAPLVVARARGRQAV